MRLFIIIILCSFELVCWSQDISGTWIGNYQKNILMTNPQKLVVEIFVYNDSLVTGASHLFFRNSNYEHYKIKGIFHKKDSSISFTEDSTISIKLGFMSSNCLGLYTMKLTSTDTSLNLMGKWKDKSRSILHCPTTNVWLEKKLSKKQIFPEEEKDSTIRIADKNLKRNSDIQSLIEINKNEADSIKIDVYDNGEIDDDSISIYFNDTLIIYNKRISINPISFYIHPGKQTNISKIKLAAESTGSIPPCTALMIITTKKKRYEVNLSSNFSSNAVIEFFLKE